MNQILFATYQIKIFREHGSENSSDAINEWFKENPSFIVISHTTIFNCGYLYTSIIYKEEQH